MRKSTLKNRLQSGDTIIEVLIAIAVVSLVLAGAYSITNHSSMITQDTQERSQALQLVKRQVEFLRQTKSLPAHTTCFSSDGSAVDGSDCNVGSDGQPTTDEPVYHMSIAPGATNGCASSPTGSVYGVQAWWNSLLGGKSKVTICYKVYST